MTRYLIPTVRLWSLFLFHQDMQYFDCVTATMSIFLNKYVTILHLKKRKQISNYTPVASQYCRPHLNNGYYPK